MHSSTPALRALFVTTAAALGVLVTAAGTLAHPGPGRASRAGEGDGPVSPDASSVPYASGEDGYDTYRIPAVVRTAEGALLAFAEGRVGGAGDTGDIDIVVRRSTDGGRTWGPLTVVARGEGDTRGNPAPVVDPATGRVVLVTCFNGGGATEAAIMRGEVAPEDSRRVFVQTSDDDGRTFDEPREITDAVKPAHWRWYATGPGHAIALTRGEHAGRLVVPSNHSAAPPEGSPDTGQEAKYYGAHALVSDDGGDTWRIGYVDDSYEGELNANESLAAELPDGRLYFNARDQNGSAAGNRLDSYSADGGETLERPYRVQASLNDVPVVQGSVLQVAGGRHAPLLFAGPSDPGARRALAVWRSDDAGASFRRVATLSEAPAAYSDLVQLDEGRERGANAVGVLWETGTGGPYERIEFRRLADF
ncbi:sialidase family protein [Streptomyces marincola]|uniref:sialidase family protein n=1 Tax=Streptomyces marincola TaxID=2878388 RepID=UPI001CF4C060|nr:sialidase family protein [Streptomyces marincola]UCM89837.1 glycoside hydrolase [Streptomyces marincola]